MDNVINITEKQKELIEKLGVLCERDGMQPAAARIVALLLVSDVTDLTFDNIREALQMSKSATSNALNLLLGTGKIEYITKPGDRKRYFKSKLGSWKEEVRESFKNFSVVSNLFKDVLAQRPAETAEFNGKLTEVTNFLDFLIDELPKVYTKWEKENS